MTTAQTITTTALAIGAVAAALLEVIWWAQGSTSGEKRLWRSSSA